MVTILILIDGFLQLKKPPYLIILEISHNPYFNRWFSAIYIINLFLKINGCHNPYFNRWFSAIQILQLKQDLLSLSQSLF